MSVQVKRRRDTAVFLSTFTGAAGELLVDTTVNRIQIHDGVTAGGWPAPAALSVQNGGSTNNSNAGSGTFINHTPTFTIPASFMIARRAFRVSVHLQMSTGAAPPQLLHRLSFGGTVIGFAGGFIPAASLTNVGFMLEWIFQATQAPSASSNVQCALHTGTRGGENGNINLTAMPVAVATNAAQDVTIATQWFTAGVGVNTIALNQLIVEALN